MPLVRWAYGDSLPDSAHDVAVANKTIFMDWFNSNILVPVTDPLQCSSAILVYPGDSGDPFPRNEYFDPPGPPIGFFVGRISPFAEVPDHVVPIGQVSSLSSITNHTESLPVSVNVMAARGCDGLLIKLAQDLVAKGAVVVPKAGQTIYGGDVLLRKKALEMGVQNLRYVG